MSEAQLLREIAGLKSELGLSAGRLDPALYTSPKRLKAQAAVSPPKTLTVTPTKKVETRERRLSVALVQSILESIDKTELTSSRKSFTSTSDIAGESSRSNLNDTAVLLATEGPGWVVERVDATGEEVQSRFLRLEQPQPGWYESHMKDASELVTFCGHTDALGDFSVSATTEVNNGRKEIVAFIRTAEGGDEVIKVSYDVLKNRYGRKARKSHQLYAKALSPLLSKDGNGSINILPVPKKFAGEALQDLLHHEQSSKQLTFRFGVVRQKDGDETEEDMLANGPTDRFERFLALFSQRVDLKGFQGFRGGLNHEEHKFSYVKRLGELEIMFHVGPHLPSNEGGVQQLGKKRYIGNNCVCIVFQDHDCKSSFPAGAIVSKFLHVVIVVRPVDVDNSAFRVAVQFRDTVEKFGPVIEHQRLSGGELGDWLLRKCILGEMAAQESPSFKPLLQMVKKKQLAQFRKSWTPGKK